MMNAMGDVMVDAGGFRDGMMNAMDDVMIVIPR